MTIRSRRAARRAFKGDPFEEARHVFVVETFGDDPDPEEEDPTGADLATPEPLPAGAVRSGDDIYADGRRCKVVGCGVPSLGDVCLNCTMKGLAPPAAMPTGYRPPLSEDAVRRFVLAVFTCDTEVDGQPCGQRLGHDMLCPVGGRAHAGPELLRWLDEVAEVDA